MIFSSILLESYQTLFQTPSHFRMSQPNRTFPMTQMLVCLAGELVLCSILVGSKNGDWPICPMKSRTHRASKAWVLNLLNQGRNKPWTVQWIPVIHCRPMSLIIGYLNLPLITHWCCFWCYGGYVVFVVWRHGRPWGLSQFIAMKVAWCSRRQHLS